MATRINRLPAAIDKSGLSRSEIYRRVANGSFPKPVALGRRAIGWRESDITAWIDSLAPKSSGKE